MNSVDAYVDEIVNEQNILNDKREICENIKRLRKERGLNQAEFAQKLDMDAKYLSHLEKGDYSWSREKMIKVMEVLGVSPNQVFPSRLSANAADAKLNRVLIELRYLSQDDQAALIELFGYQVQMMAKKNT